MKQDMISFMHGFDKILQSAFGLTKYNDEINLGHIMKQDMISFMHGLDNILQSAFGLTKYNDEMKPGYIMKQDMISFTHGSVSDSINVTDK